MIPLKDSVVTKSGNLSGETIQMSLDENSIEHLQVLLSDIYSDVEMAVIREYACNAYDSHKAAGVNKPIEITLPTVFEPTFICKDYGVGMSVDDIRNIYSKYGASTKRDTNEQTGMLGIGAKCALAYTDSFSVIGIKNGVKTTALVSKNEVGTGEFQIIDTSATDEPNGVTISVPVKSYWSFNSKAEDFFKFWSADSILVDGKTPETYDGLEFGSGVKIVKGLREDYFVMGNVPYKIHDKSARYGEEGIIPGRRTIGLVIPINIGDVTFTPSREELAYTKRTVDLINSYRESWKADLNAHIAKQISSLPTKGEALDIFYEWAAVYGEDKIARPYYKGFEIPHKFGNAKIWYLEVKRYSVRSETDISTARLITPHRRWDNSIEKPLLVTGFAATSSITATIKNKVKKWMSDNTQFKTVVFVDFDSSQMEWLSTFTQVSFEEISKIKLPKKVSASTGSASISGQFKVANPKSQGWLSALSIDKKANVFYITPSKYGLTANEVPSQNIYKVIPDDSVVVFINAGSERNFLKKVPNAKPLSEYLIQEAKKLTLTKAEEINLSSERLSYSYGELKNAGVKDKELLTYAKALEEDTLNIIKYKNFLNPFIRGIVRDNLPQPKKYPNPMEKYPLVSRWSKQNIKHVALYINAVVESESNNKESK